MRSCRFVVMITIAAVLSFAASSGAQQGPPMPTPGPEHEVLKADVGTWDAVVEFVPGPGAPPMTSKGVETNRLGCGGLCLISEFKGDMMGMPFHGVGITTWDPAQKKYVGSWTDSMAQGIATMEGTWDPAAKRLSGWMEGPDPSGQRMKSRTVVESRGDSRVMTAYASVPGGQEMQILRITYTRRK